MAARDVYEFGPFRVDPALCRLQRGDTPVPLPPKAFDLLLLLVRNPTRVLGKGELIQALWPDTFVDDANLTQQVFTLRKALGVGPNGAAYIETVPRRGYVFAAEVREKVDGAARADTTPATPPIEGERKQATVLTCGLMNASALVERLGPARFEAVMSDLVAAATEETARYDGMLHRTRPDGLEVVFGARVVHEDGPWRAVLAALALQRRLRHLERQDALVDEGPAVAIGIATGPVVVSRRTQGSDAEYSAVGDAMRIADLLQQLAAPDTILISDATRRAVEGHVALERTPVDVGGPAFRVTGTAPVRVGRSPRLMRRVERFVGRVHEFGLLVNLAARVRGGRGQVAAIFGEPGIGKSRLLLEFTSALPDVTVLESRCASYGSLVPFLPLADLVRMYCGVADGDSAGNVRRAVRSAVAALDLPVDADTWLLRLAGVEETAREPISPEAIKARTFEVLCALLRQAGARRPVLVAVEDVHWIDRTSEEFLALLVERIVGSRVLLVVTSRPGYRTPWSDRSYVTALTLPPLEPADGQVLIEAVAGQHAIPAPLAETILTKADGNPLFLEELTRAVLEDGRADRVPDTVHAVITARIDRLAPSSKRLLQAMAVLGRAAPMRLLTRVWPDAAQMTAEIETLCRLEFVYEQVDRGERVFTFTHALTQDVAYDSLLARQRQDLHLAAARALEDIHADRIDEATERLAYHYARTDRIEEAVAWLVRAADRAARAYANTEAILHLDLARRRLERLSEGPDRDRREVEVALKHAHSLYFLGQWRDSVEVLRPYGGMLVRLNDPGLSAKYSFWLAHMYTRLGDQRQTAEHATRAIDMGSAAGDWATVGKAHGALALDAHWSGATRDGLAHGAEAVRILAADDDQRWWLGMAHFYLAMNHLIAGDFEPALAEAARAGEIGNEIADPRLQTYAGFLTAWVEASRGGCDTALAVCRRSRELAPDRVSHAFASMILGYALLEAGDHHAARGRLEPLIAEFDAFGFAQWQAWASALAAETYRRDGALDAASPLVERGRALAVQTQYWYAVGFAERIAGRIARDQGRGADASHAFDSARRTFARIGARFEEDRTRTEAAAS